MESNKKKMHGCLFNNRYKEKDNHPDYSGRMEIDDISYFLSGWVRRSQSEGKPYISLSMKVADEKYQKKTDSSEQSKKNHQEMMHELNAPMNPTGYKPNVTDHPVQPSYPVKDDDIPF